MVTAQQIHERDLKTPSLVLGATIVGTLILALRDPHAGGYGTCHILALTGYQCPTCGGLRAVHDLAHLDFAGAWVMNPLLTLTLPVLAFVLVGWWWRAWRGYRAIPVPAPVILIGAAVLVVFGILRNIL